MRLLPLRRWFQFRLSTWFVLVAILGWAMVVRETTHTYEVRAFDAYRLRSKRDLRVSYDSKRDVTTISYRQWRPDAMAWPALALVAFLSWKAAWAIGSSVGSGSVSQAGSPNGVRNRF
jgi:hypothetical protein